MRKEYWGEIPDGPEAREWVRNIMDQSIWTVKEVQALYGLSQSTVSRLYTKHDWKFAFKKGNQILFLADYAKPWFDQYNAEQNVNRSAEQVNPETGKRKPGRPKKDKPVEEWRNTWLDSWNIIIGEEFASPEAWFRDLSTRMSIYFRDKLGTDDHKDWLEKRKVIRTHFGLPENRL